LRWPEGEGYDKGFLIIAYPVRALTDDVARSRMRNGSTASFLPGPFLDLIVSRAE